MTRTLLRLLGLLVLAALVCAPALFYDTSSSGSTSSYEDTSITNYGADFTVATNGDLAAREQLSVKFPYGGKHGIFRFWDTSDRSDPHARRIPEDITVTRDGSDEPVSMSTEQRGRFKVAQIGSATTTLTPGLHTYVIGYSIKGVLEKGTTGQPSQFYWNLIPGGWRQAIDQATLTVHLPVASAADVQCAVGEGAGGGCRVEGAGTDTLTVNVSNLPARTPVTIKAGLDLQTPATGNARVFSPRWDPVVGPSGLLALLVVLLGCVAAVLGERAARSTREPTPPYPLMYAPPEGIGPAQGAYILTERLDRPQFVATLLEAAEKKAVQLNKSDAGWSVDGAHDAELWKPLDEVTTQVGHSLGITGGGSFTANKRSVADGQALKGALAAFDTSTKVWASEKGFMTLSGLGSSGGLAVGLSAAATVALLIWNPLNFSLLAWLPGVFGVFAAELALPGSGTKRTATGRELWSRLGGFRRVLSTPSSENRFDFSGRQELYTLYIPWAVAFGCADAWAKKYRVEVGAEPPVPAYFGGYYGGQTGAYINGIVSDFNSTLDSAISAYTASQSSSSGGGGGGFSGGGGGGGGGGGSW